MAEPVVSIIIPVYNPGSYLAPALESCLGQTLAELEVICIDDGSSDGSLDELRRIAATDARIRVLAQQNAGAAAARNRGLAEASGEFIFFLDADDYIPEPTALERLVAAAREADVDVAGGSMVIDRAGAVDAGSLHGRALDSFDGEGVCAYRDWQYDYDFTRFIYRLALLRDRGISFPLRTQFEDPVFFVHAMVAAERFATIPDAVYAYRYAYRRRSWSVRGVCDRLDGITELLELSGREGLAVLHRHLIHQLEDEMSSVTWRFVGTPAVDVRLARANVAVDAALLRTVEPATPEDYVIRPLRQVNRFFARTWPLHLITCNRYAEALKRRLKR